MSIEQEVCVKLDDEKIIEEIKVLVSGNHHLIL